MQEEKTTQKLLEKLTLDDNELYAHQQHYDLEKQHCIQCEKLLPELQHKRCGTCKLMYYCSVECQKKHWTLIHSKQCVPIVKNLLLVEKTENQPFDIVLKSPFWRLKMVAVNDIKEGDLIIEEKPLIYISAYTREEVGKMMPELQQCLFVKGSFDVVNTAEDIKKQKDALKKTTDEIINDETKPVSPTPTPVKKERLLLFNDKCFEDFPLASTRFRMTYVLIMEYLYVMNSRFFQTGLLVEDEEKEGIIKLHEFILKKHNIEIPVDLVSFAYCVSRQSTVAIFDQITTSSFFGDAFLPKIYCINHACNPNSLLTFSEGYFRLFATRDIKKGDQIFRDYLNGDSDVHYWDPRRRIIMNNFHFVCKCERCIQDQLDSNISKKPSFPKKDDVISEEDKRTQQLLELPLSYLNDQNISNPIKTRLKIILKDASIFYYNNNNNKEAGDLPTNEDFIGKNRHLVDKQLLLSLVEPDNRDLVFYLFFQNWPLFYTLVRNCLLYETARYRRLLPIITSKQAIVSVEILAKERHLHDPVDKIDEKYTNQTCRPQYLILIDMIITIITQSKKDIEKQHHSTTKRLAIFHALRIFLILKPFVEYYLKDTNEADKEFMHDMESIQEASELVSIERGLGNWFNNHLLKIITSPRELSILKESIFYLSLTFKSYNTDIGCWLFNVDVAATPSLYMVYFTIIRRIREYIILKEHNADANKKKVVASHLAQPPPSSSSPSVPISE